MYKAPLQLVIFYKYLFFLTNGIQSPYGVLFGVYWELPIHSKQNLHYWKHNKCMFIVKYLFLYVLIKYCGKLPEDGYSALTCRS